MKLDLLIYLSLSPQTGEYLQDSFRHQSLVPAFSAVEEELKQLITTDEWHMVEMLIISGAGLKVKETRKEYGQK